jgi:hypothetical protein
VKRFGDSTAWLVAAWLGFALLVVILAAYH